MAQTFYFYSPLSFEYGKPNSLICCSISMCALVKSFSECSNKQLPLSLKLVGTEEHKTDPKLPEREKQLYASGNGYKRMNISI